MGFFTHLGTFFLYVWVVFFLLLDFPVLSIQLNRVLHRNLSVQSLLEVFLLFSLVK